MSEQETAESICVKCGKDVASDSDDKFVYCSAKCRREMVFQ